MDNKTEISQQELLAALAEGQQKALRQSRLISAVCLVIAALLLLLMLLTLPRITGALGQLEGALTTLEGAMDTIGHLDSTLSAVDGAMGQLSGLAENAEALSGMAANLGELDIDGLNSGIRAFGQLDFEKLDQAINDLSDVIEPLSSFASLFG